MSDDTKRSLLWAFLSFCMFTGIGHCVVLIGKALLYFQVAAEGELLIKCVAVCGMVPAVLAILLPLVILLSGFEDTEF